MATTDNLLVLGTAPFFIATMPIAMEQINSEIQLRATPIYRTADRVGIVCNFNSATVQKHTNRTLTAAMAKQELDKLSRPTAHESVALQHPIDESAVF